MIRKKVLGMGEILWDLLPNGRQLGGAPANFAFHAKQLGLDAGVVSAVGQDSDGKDILEMIMRFGLRSFIGVNEKPTGTVSVTLDDQGVPVYVIHQNVAWDFVNPMPDATEWVQEAAAICFGSLAQRSPRTRKTILELLDIAPSDCLKIFDINLRQKFYSKDIIEASLQKANILKINDEEILTLGSMFGLGDQEEIIAERALRQFRLDYLALTKGSTGSWMFSAFDSSWLPTPKVAVADTVGAGDSFTAAMAAGIISGKKLQVTHQLAVDVSAYVCTQRGATPELPDKIKLEFE
jgi:fructokinase